MRSRQIPYASTISFPVFQRILVCLIAFGILCSTGNISPAFAATTITDMEYFFDSDPGPGNGTPITIPSDSGPTFLFHFTEIAIDTLSQGSHLLFVRAKDNDGVWGPARQVHFEMPHAGIAIDPVHIDQAEYFIDSDPGEGLGESISPPPGEFYDSLREAVTITDIDTSNLTIGYHTLYVRMRSSDGTWGRARPLRRDLFFPSPYNVEVTGTNTVEAMEYFFDVDPGEGLGIPLTPPPAMDNRFAMNLKGLSTDHLATGEHVLFVRAKDSDGFWGPKHQKWFEIIETNLTISGIEYFIDTDPGIGNGTPLPSNDGSYDEGAEQASGLIDTTYIAEGYHTLFTRAQDSSGKWSELDFRDITIGYPPHIASLSPYEGLIGDTVVISGIHFGDSQDTSIATFTGLNNERMEAGVISWSDTEVFTLVPESAISGPVLITVKGVDSNLDHIFSVTPDNDGDGIPNEVDNCPEVKNALQEDQDTDALGDVCESLHLPSVCHSNPDCDDDGLLDGWEVNGHHDIDLKAMGANPLRKDIFVKIDWMEGTATHTHKPHQRAIKKVVSAFANAPVRNVDGSRGISLHPEVSNEAIPHWNEINFRPIDGEDNDFYDIKNQHFDPKLGDVFHYAVFAHQLMGMGCTSGQAEIWGNDLIVTLGGNSCKWGKDSNGHSIGTVNQQAGTFMHELGHNLGLRHGGNEDENFDPGIDGSPGERGIDDPDYITDEPNGVIDDPLEQCRYDDICHRFTNYGADGMPGDAGIDDDKDNNIDEEDEQCYGDDECIEVAKATKPNHLSVMNYSFQAGSLVWGRVDYSRHRLRDLDENNLNEFLGIGGIPWQTTKYSCKGEDKMSLMSFPIDWNCDGFYWLGVEENINDLSYGNRKPSFASIYSNQPNSLRGVNEWENLFLNFRDSGQFAEGVHTLIADQELTAEQAELIPEISLPVEVCDGIDNNDNGQVDESYDADGDGLSDCFDNCPYQANQGQDDLDRDGFGDACDLDSDNDGLSDTFEQDRSYTNPMNPDTDGDGIPDAEEDDDLDGYTNELEQISGTDPENIDQLAKTVTVTVDLRPGFNSINLPVESTFFTALTPEIFLIGGPDAIESVYQHDQLSGLFRHAYFDSEGHPAGDALSIKRDRGLIVYAKTSQSMTYSIRLECPVYDFKTGLNHVGLPCIQSGTTSFQLLQAIGDEMMVSSIQRYNSTKGQFETAAYHNGQFAGVDFPIVAGEGYFINMRQEVLGFQP